jgi:hypothetical protein
MAVRRAMEVNLDDFVMVEDESVLGGREVAGKGRATEDLQKGRFRRGVVLDAVEFPLPTKSAR